MANMDEQLKLLRQQVSRRQHLSAVLKELELQHEELLEKVSQLEAVKQAEQADVDRLEGRSLAAFFYQALGTSGEKLAKERQEAYAAAVKYDAAVRELDAVERDLAHYRAELSELSDCENRYDKLLEEKLAALKAHAGSCADEIRAIESRIAYLEHQMDEIDEAIAAGSRALACANEVADSLSSAKNWGILDVMGGGLFTDIAKHSHLDDAQRKVEQLQVELRRFNTELADVSAIHVDAQVSVDGFLRFADYFFDNLFTDLAVMDRISQSRDQVCATISQIEDTISRLNRMMDEHQKEWKNLHNELDELVLKAQL